MLYFKNDWWSLVYKVIPILYFGFLSIIIFYWYKGHEFLFGIDTIFPLNKDFLTEYTNIWSNKIAYGGEDIFKLPVLFPYVITLWAVSGLLKFEDWEIIQRIVIYFLFFSGGIGCFYLSKVSYKNLNILSHLIAGTFYMFNFYVLYLITPLPIYLMFSYFMFPIVFASYIYVVRNISRLKLIKSILIFAGCYVLVSTSYATTPYILIHIGIIFLYTGFCAYKKDINKKSAQLGISLFLAVFLALSAFWVYPFTKTDRTKFSTIVSSIDNGLSSYKLNSSEISDILLLQGYFGLNESFNGTPFYKWYAYYKTPGMLILALIIVILFIAPLAINSIDTVDDKYNKRIFLFFLFIVLIFIFLITFLNTPFDSTFTYVFQKINFFNYFRTAYQRFTGFIALGIALSLSYSYHILSYKLRNYMPKLIYLLPMAYLSVIVIYVWPLFTDEIFSSNDIFPSKATNIPKDYYEIARYLDTKVSEDKSVLLLPFNKLGLYSLLWNKGENGYEGLHPLLLMGKARLVNSDILGFSVGEFIEKYLIDSSFSAKELASAFNVGYIMLHKDLNTKTSHNNSWWVGVELENLQNKISTDQCLILDKETAYFDLYKIRDECQAYKFTTFDKKSTIKLNETDAYLDVAAIPIMNQNLFLSCENKLGGCDFGNNTVIKGTEVLDYANSFRDHSSITLPNTSAKPGSFKYNLIIIKENIIEYFNKRNNITNLDLDIWFLAKRMQELVKWPLSNNEKNTVKTKINGVKEALLNRFRETKYDDRDETYYDAIDKIIYYADSSSKSTQDEESRKYLSSIIAELKSLYDYESNCGDSVCYRFLIAESDEYIIKNVLNDKSSARYYVDNKEVDYDSKIYLSKGVHFIYIKSLTDLGSSFLGVSKTLERIPSQTYSRIYETVSEIILPEWDPKETYEFSFEFNIDKGKLILSIDDRNVDYSSINVFSELYKQSGQSFLSINDRVVTVLEKDLTNNDSKRLKFILSPGKLSKSKGNLRFIYVFDKNQPSGTVSIKNLFFRKLPSKEPVLYRGDSEFENTSIKKLEYVKLDTSLYKVTMPNPENNLKMLNFKERFDRGWQIYALGKYSMLDKGRYLYTSVVAYLLHNKIYPYGYKKVMVDHYRSNALDNAWDVSNISDKEVFIYYEHENHLYTGILISLISFSGIIVCTFILAKKLGKF